MDRNELPERERRAHLRARGRGVSRPLYGLARVLLTPPLRLWFRFRVSGAENVPAEGPAILTPNHKSFLDILFIGLAVRRHVRYMAKIELFKWPLSTLFPRLGAFPVRRGAADAEALETARAILAGGGLVAVFPEGTRVDEPDALGSPHHGAGRLALETGAPIVPAAISGTHHHLWLGPVPKPRRVQLAFLEPVIVTDLAPARETLEDLIDRQVWPAVQEEYGRLRASPGLVAAGLAAVGLGGIVASRWRTAKAPRILGQVAPLRARRKKALHQRLRRLPFRGRR